MIDGVITQVYVIHNPLVYMIMVVHTYNPVTVHHVLYGATQTRKKRHIQNYFFSSFSCSSAPFSRARKYSNRASYRPTTSNRRRRISASSASASSSPGEAGDPTPSFSISILRGRCPVLRDRLVSIPSLPEDKKEGFEVANEETEPLRSNGEARIGDTGGGEFGGFARPEERDFDAECVVCDEFTDRSDLASEPDLWRAPRPSTNTDEDADLVDDEERECDEKAEGWRWTAGL